MSSRNRTPEPQPGERPAVYADRLGRWYAASVSNVHKKDFGQYLTPLNVADFMARLCAPVDGSIRVLDPGAGAGILSCALCEALAVLPNAVSRISLVAYETDKLLAEYLRQSLAYVADWLGVRGIPFEFIVKTDDFVLSNAAILDETPRLFPDYDITGNRFDLIIANPPYFKVPKSDPRAQATSSIVHGQPNIYAMFMAISAWLLRPGGQLVFITPRSYASGPYFRAFRQCFFTTMRPKRVHIFSSRREAFDRDDVLQENIILWAERDDGWVDRHSGMDMVIVSSSMGARDLERWIERRVPVAAVLDAGSKDRIIRIPVSEADDECVRVVESWTGSLHAYGLEVSTGPVVAFRAADFLAHRGSVPETHAPLLWLQNVRAMRIDWPLGGHGKEQYIRADAESMPLLVSNANYVLLRRFSAKEDAHRLVAAPLLAHKLHADVIGLENHLNYIYRPHGSLSTEEAYGLAALLNSSLLDTYFRVSNGNTQVSATELRSLPLPSSKAIMEIGRQVMALDGSNGESDAVVEHVLLDQCRVTTEGTYA